MHKASVVCQCAYAAIMGLLFYAEFNLSMYVANLFEWCSKLIDLDRLMDFYSISFIKKMNNNKNNMKNEMAIVWDHVVVVRTCIKEKK